MAGQRHTGAGYSLWFVGPAERFSGEALRNPHLEMDLQPSMIHLQHIDEVSFLFRPSIFRPTHPVF